MIICRMLINSSKLVLFTQMIYKMILIHIITKKAPWSIPSHPPPKRKLEAFDFAYETIPCD